jgi:hypothetical protein
MNFADMAVMTTAWRRPYYFEQVLNSWANTEGIDETRRFVISLGPTDRHDQQVTLIGRMRPRFGVDLEILPQSEAAVHGDGRRVPFGPHRAIAEAITHVFADPAVQFVVAGEEDVLVSSDTLTYMRWAAEKFEGDPQVLAVVAHNQHGQGWDDPGPAEDEDADQDAARLLPYFSPWCWGTWRDKWEKILEPEWDYNCDLGGPLTSGYDWVIQTQILPRHSMVCVVPDASRSQNIGSLEGWASTPQIVAGAQSHSFRRQRDEPAYRLV